MDTEDKYTRHTHSYWALRKAVGWIGILLPFTLMIGVFIIFKENVIQESISHYYHTDFVFWAETIALVAFGVSWLTKSGTLHPDK